jgi:hypothetical protein
MESPSEFCDEQCVGDRMRHRELRKERRGSLLRDVFVPAAWPLRIDDPHRLLPPLRQHLLEWDPLRR